LHRFNVEVGMPKSEVKPSDRGRNQAEPGPTPGTRAQQRDTDEQLAAAKDGGDGATAFEREEQEKLPPRGEGSQHNQGPAKGPTLHETEPRVESPVDEEIRRSDAPAGTPDAEFHSGGTRGPSHKVG
jgi:hypothetical protein